MLQHPSLILFFEPERLFKENAAQDQTIASATFEGALLASQLDL
jgi:hypothetical protein